MIVPSNKHLKNVPPHDRPAYRTPATLNAESSRTQYPHARILLVDDEEANLAMLSRLLKYAGYENLFKTRDGAEVVTLVDSLEPDLICLDLNMPGIDGYEVLRRLGEVIPRTTYLPILMLTGEATPGTLQRALSLGASDFVAKPFEPDEVRLRIHNLLVPRFMHLELQESNRLLESRVRDRTHDLEQAQLEMLQRLARASEFRDDETGQHTRRVGRSAALLARCHGLTDEFTDLIAKAAELHDVGKIGVPDGILLKKGKLSDVEFEMMKAHTHIGAEILEGGKTALIQLAREIAAAHHEKWDGSGYPHGLRGEAIPISARIVAIADFFDALTHDRPYRKAWAIDRTLQEISSQSGKHFDPNLVSCFLDLPHNELI